RETCRARVFGVSDGERRATARSLYSKGRRTRLALYRRPARPPGTGGPHMLRTALSLPTLAALAGLAAPAAAQVGGTLADGNAIYIQQQAPNAETVAGPSSTSFLPDGTTNHMAQNWWWYRVNAAGGTVREYPFGTYTRSSGGGIAGTSTYAGNTSTYNWTETDNAGFIRFTAVYTTTLTDVTTQSNTAKITQTLQINNFTPGFLN